MKTNTLIFSFIFLLLATMLFSQEVEIYVSDAGNFNQPPWQILKFDENGENPEQYISENLIWPQDIVFLEDQHVVLISNLGSPGYISKHNISTGVFIENFADGIAGPTRMKIGSDSLLYVLQWSSTNNKVLRYKLDGSFVDEFTSAGVSQSIGLDWDTAGYLYVSSYGGKYVQRFDTAGVDQGRFINANLAGPTNIWFEENGDLMVLDYNAGKVKRFSPSGEYLGEVITAIDYPEGIAFKQDGNMLIGSGGGSSVKEYTPEGEYVKDIIPSGSGDLLTPNAVVIRETLTTSRVELQSDDCRIGHASGKKFILNRQLVSEITSLHIYNLAGNLIGDVDVQREQIWDATDKAGGLYFVVAKTNNGLTRSQKFLIR